MMDAVIRNLAIGTGLEVTGSFVKIIGEFEGSAAAKSVSSALFSFSIATMGMSIILYYILPLLPFVYFLFAVSGWVKSIFEAMVAMPLWALAHLQIDGEGMSGRGASNGYFLIMEIFLRPILILFGLVASLATFSAFVGVAEYYI